MNGNAKGHNTAALTMSIIALGTIFILLGQQAKQPHQTALPEPAVEDPKSPALQQADNTPVEQLSNAELIDQLGEIDLRHRILRSIESDEPVLVEMLRRGDREFEPALQRLVLTYKARREEWQREIARLEPLQPKDGRPHEELTQAEKDLMQKFVTAENSFESAAPKLELLIALRRLQERPDPARVIVTGLTADSYSIQWPDMPTLNVSVRNMDTLQEPVISRLGGNNRSGRAERFKIQVRNTQTGHVIVETLPPPSTFGGGIVGATTLEFGEGWHTSLPKADFVPQLQPGEYAIRVLYHDHECIADRPSTEDHICCKSREYELTIYRRTVQQTKEQTAAIAALLSQLDRSQHVRIVDAPYGEWASDFIPPKSILGQILTAGWQAVPALLEELEDESQTLAERAHTLAMLFSITGQVDPRGESRMQHYFSSEKSSIGPFAYVRQGKGVSHHMDGDRIGSSRSYNFGSLHRVGLPELEPGNPNASHSTESSQAAMELDKQSQSVLVDQWRQLRKLITVVDPDNPPSHIGGGRVAP